MNRKTFAFWTLFIPDILLMYGSLRLSLFLRYFGKPVHSTVYFEVYTLLFAVWLVVFFIHGLFEVQTFRRYTTLFFNLISATIVNLLLAVVYFYFQPNFIFTPRRFLLIEITVLFGLLAVWYLLVKYFVKNRLVEGVYLFSFNNELAELEREIKALDFLGYKVLGHLNEETLVSTKLEKRSTIILPDNLHANTGVSAALYKLRTYGVTFYNHKDFYEYLLRRIFLSDLNEVWFLENINYREKRFYTLIKRLVDIVAGIIGLIVFGISYPFVALALKLDLNGPVLFSQLRVGQEGKIFKIYKYRSMNTVTGTVWTSVNDPRITPVGNFMRKSRIDELPQSLNLLAGNISLVGRGRSRSGLWSAYGRKFRFTTSVIWLSRALPAGASLIFTPAAWKKLNSSSSMTSTILSTGRSCLI